MHGAKLTNVDLNLLVALQALVEERNITHAARRMFVSQPSMSRIVDRMQDMFGDQLLVRTANGYQPTQRALAACAELQVLLPRLQALFAPGAFDPAKAGGVFRIESTDWGATILIPRLIAVVAKQAPNVTIEVIPTRRGFERLAAYEVDLVLTPDVALGTGKLEGTSFRTMPLVKERFVCLMRRGHPLAKGHLTAKRYLNAEHASLETMQAARRSPGPLECGTLLGPEKDLRRLRNVRTRIPYFSSIGPIVEQTDLIATLPSHIGRRLKSSKIHMVPAPKEILGFTVVQVWQVRSDDVPLHRWLRETLRTVAARITMSSLR